MLREHTFNFNRLCKLEKWSNEAEIWYVVDGHDIFQIRQFSLKTSLRLTSYEVFRFSATIWAARVAPKTSSYQFFPKKKSHLIVYIFTNMVRFDSFHFDM